MIRRFNYTQRQRIPKSQAAVRLERSNGEFDVELRLTTLGLPDDARVYVEAYFHGTVMRFDYGTVAAVEPPTDRRLTRFLQPELVFFRVKIVGQSQFCGLLLATCDRLMPLVETGGPATRRTIIQVQPTLLTGDIWRLRFYDERDELPVLELNNEIPAVKEIARNDAGFAALVYPAVVRRVLEQVLVRDKHEHDDSDTDDSWQELWIRFGIGLVKERPPKCEDEVAVNHWIDDVVTRFSARQKYIRDYKRSLGAAELVS